MCAGWKRSAKVFLRAGTKESCRTDNRSTDDCRKSH